MSVARQLGKKFEAYKTRKTDANQLLFHSLKKLVNDKAIYERYVRGLEEGEHVDIQIPLDQFEHEARDFEQHNISDFLKSSLFNKEYTIEGRFIKTTSKV